MLRKTRLKKYSDKGRIRREEKTENTKKLHEWFMEIWKKRAHYSEVSGRFLGHEANTTFFHHIFPKSLYPELVFDELNIILLTTEEHGKVESDSLCYNEINIRRKELEQ